MVFIGFLGSWAVLSTCRVFFQMSKKFSGILPSGFLVFRHLLIVQSEDDLLVWVVSIWESK